MSRMSVETTEPLTGAKVAGAVPSGRLSDLTAQQWRSALAAWLGWLFDGLDIHLYTLVAAPFVMELLHAASPMDADVKARSALIQAAFLVGWAVGGAVFGRIGDRLGRSRALGLTILTYACFTGLSYFAQTWWQLMIFRFTAALGIGGEWAVGSALLAETWPARLRPWAAACLQTAVNFGVFIAIGVVYLLPNNHRAVFLVGVLPAAVVYWIRKSVLEPQTWTSARRLADSARGAGGLSHPVAASATGVAIAITAASLPPAGALPDTGVLPDTVASPATGALPDSAASPRTGRGPGIVDLFRAPVLSITVRTIIVCGCSLTAWWAFLFWINQHVRNLPEVAAWDNNRREHLVATGFFAVIGTSIAGNFFSGALAVFFGYRRAITFMFIGFFAAMIGTFAVPRTHGPMLGWMASVGFFSGVFGLFTMYLPPLFPVLIRTTGAGLCFNVGRLAAAAGTIVFGLFSHIGDFRLPLLVNSFLIIPAALTAWTLPDLES